MFLGRPSGGDAAVSAAFFFAVAVHSKLGFGRRMYDAGGVSLPYPVAGTERTARYVVARWSACARYAFYGLCGT